MSNHTFKFVGFLVLAVAIGTRCGAGLLGTLGLLIAVFGAWFVGYDEGCAKRNAKKAGD